LAERWGWVPSCTDEWGVATTCGVVGNCLFYVCRDRVRDGVLLGLVVSVEMVLCCLGRSWL